MFVRAGSEYFGVGHIRRAVWVEEERSLSLFLGPDDEPVTLDGDAAVEAHGVLEALCVRVDAGGSTEP